MAGINQGPERRIVLVGKTGSGKSATANTIIGSPIFESKVAFVSVTKSCQKEETWLNGRKLVVVDTPGFLDTGGPKQETADEIKRCVSHCLPGPQAIVQVVRLGRFTEEEKEVAQLIRDVFSLKAKAYLIILFTRKEDLQGRPLQEFLAEGDQFLQQQIRDCGGRCLAFNNKAEGAEREAQVGQLIQMMDDLVEKNKYAPCYTREMLEEDKATLKKRGGAFSWLCPLL